MSMSISSAGGMQPPRMDPEEMKKKMQETVDKLKTTDPALAEKMEKINSRMEELRKSGTDQKTAMKTVKDEFGELSDKEKQELQDAMGTPEGPGGRKFGISNKGIKQLESSLTDALTQASASSNGSLSLDSAISAIKSTLSKALSSYSQSSTDSDGDSDSSSLALSA